MFIRRESFSQYIRLYPVVSILLALNIIVFLITILPFIGIKCILPEWESIILIAAGEWWRLFTPMFLHAGIMHILFNMFCLFVFGPELEKMAGKTRFLTIYLLSGIFGNVATCISYKTWRYAHVGASGAIFGIFGAFGALVYYTKTMLPELRQIILPIIAISIVMTFIQSNINVTAHIAGLIVGFLIGLSYFHPKRIVSWRKGKDKEVTAKEWLPTSLSFSIYHLLFLDRFVPSKNTFRFRFFHMTYLSIKSSCLILYLRIMLRHYFFMEIILLHFHRLNSISSLNRQFVN